MTPAINAAKQAQVNFILHEYEHDPAAESYGEEAAEKTGANPAQVFKTLVVSLDGKNLAVGIVPVTAMLGLKQIAKLPAPRKPSWPTNSWCSAPPAMSWVGSVPWARKNL